ncbi:inosine-uridine preferring nucleoside hydrolase-like isoform X1 [Pieris napi]|uniref:inosine-uridine preferring nucleoside hydrolase-like isoform X1 n=1 Tax=Pieris napi TaxID=78633 RepID=UPI001FBB71E0|nr:inosine-uridine preferring nucleoside hydrolase-like isoform X1 [Pieris napi]
MIFVIGLALILNSVTYCVKCESKILIDNDAGADDAMAIFLALLNEKYYDGPKLVGLTTGNGNTNENNVFVNNQKILKVAKRQDVPIYRGSKASLVTTPYAGDYFGLDGLGDIDEVHTDLVPAAKQDAVSALIELSKTHKEQLTVITMGALTNIALAITLDPNFLGRIKHLYVGAGHIHNDEVSDAEFNAHMDVEAYHIIAKHATPEKVTVLPFSQVMAHLNLSRQWREEVFGAMDSDIVRTLNLYERITLPKSDRWHALDPAVVAIVLRPELVGEYKYAKNDIVLCGDKRGRNTNTFVEKDDANVRVIYSIKMEEFKQYLIDLFSASIVFKLQ